MWTVLPDVGEPSALLTALSVHGLLVDFLQSRTYHIQASAPLSWSNTSWPYSRKFLWTMLFNFASLVSSGRRVSATMDVMPGCDMHRWSTALPTVPVDPVRMTFILYWALGVCRRKCYSIRYQADSKTSFRPALLGIGFLNRDVIVMAGLRVRK